MKAQKLKKTALAIAILLSVSSGTVWCVTTKTQMASTMTSAEAGGKESQATKRKFLGEKKQQIEHEALEVIMGTNHALLALQKKDSNKAMSLLQEVSGKLDVLLAKYPGLNQIPANVEAEVDDFETNGKEADAKQVQKLIDQAGELLDEHKVQDAREILAQLVSEMRITTTSIPLGTYPAAVKDAVGLIAKGKTDEAEIALYDMLNTLVNTTEISHTSTLIPALAAEEFPFPPANPKPGRCPAD
ncbi:MAG TPA: YfdX family protein [Methylomicrobium sp.]|nr:YfdX family protein [Methylomicrobium sp.]